MKFNGIIVLSYGILVLLGGLIGYLTAGSLPSLISGSICGALLFASGIGLFRASILAFYTALSVSGLLSLFFSVRFYLTLKIMPAGMMAVLSLIVFLLLITTRSKPPRPAK